MLLKCYNHILNSNEYTFYYTFVWTFYSTFVLVNNRFCINCTHYFIFQNFYSVKSVCPDVGNLLTTETHILTRFFLTIRRTWLANFFEVNTMFSSETDRRLVYAWLLIDGHLINRIRYFKAFNDERSITYEYAIVRFEFFLFYDFLR